MWCEFLGTSLNTDFRVKLEHGIGGTIFSTNF